MALLRTRPPPQAKPIQVATLVLKLGLAGLVPVPNKVPGANEVLLVAPRQVRRSVRRPTKGLGHAE